MPARRRIVIAIGGNAIKPPSAPPEGGRPLWELLDQTATQIAQLARRGDQVVVIHGNGPQVGTLLLAHEAAGGSPALTLDVAGAETQGQLGYLIQQTLGNRLRGLGSTWTTAGLITQVVVDGNDRAFAALTKPIGIEYNAAQAASFERSRGWDMREVHPGRWRRVVASPRPLDIVEMGAIEALLAAGVIPIVAGGGGIPVIRDGAALSGIEAVIDKDLSAQLVAMNLRADTLAVLTDVDRAYLDFESQDPRPLDRLTVAEGWRYLRDGHFPPGSMGPKVEACLRFIEGGGQRAAIAALPKAQGAADCLTGTVFTA